MSVRRPPFQAVIALVIGGVAAAFTRTPQPSRSDKASLMFLDAVPADSSLASDNFNRSNQSPMAGNWTSTTLNLSSNHVVPTSLGTHGEAYYSGTTWPADQYSKAKLSVTGTAGGDAGMGLLVRQSPSAVTYYRLAVDHATSNNVDLSKRIAGSYTSLATFTQSWTDGDVWELRVTGTTLQILRNGSQVGTDVTDCSIASGAAGIAYSSTETAATLDDWEGGAAVTPGPTWPHEPPGFVAFKNTNFTTFPTDGWASDGATIVTDSTAPLSPTHQVIQWEFDTTLESGSSPGLVYNFEFSNAVDGYFVGFYFKFSDPFDLPANALGMWLPHFFLAFLGPDSTIAFSVPAADSVSAPNILSGNVTNPKITFGTWHQFEHYFKPASSPTAHDGILRWWIDGVLAGNYTNVQWPSPPPDWVEWSYWPGWDGDVSHPAYTSFQWVDHIYLSRPMSGLRAWDNFNRANEALLAGNWTSPESLTVDSNRVTPGADLSADGEAYYSGIVWPNDQYSRAKLSVTGTAGGDQGVGLLLRVTPNSHTEYRLIADHASSDNVGVSKMLDGSYTNLATFTQSWTDGDVWEFRVTGTTLQVFRNGSQVGTDVPDSSISAGYPGIAYSSTESAAAIDDWEGGGMLSDDFNRANETTLAGNWTSSSLALTGNHVAPSSLGTNGDASYSRIPWPNDQYSRAKLCVVGTAGSDQGPGLVVRRSPSAATYYRLAVDHAGSDNVGVSKRVAGSYTSLATFTQSWTNGDRWELRITGATLQVFRNGSQVGTDVTDSAITSGAAGIAYSSTETAATLDDWEGGAVASGVPQWPDEPVATPINPTVATTLAANTAFLYTGAKPVQTGVSDTTIEVLRAAVLRGQVFTRDSVPLPGVTVTVLDHPEFGQTITRANGFYDLAVNGGGTLTLLYARDGYLPAQRGVATTWGDYAPLVDVSLVPLDSAVTPIAFSDPIEVARGTVQSDTNGTRQATLLFRQGTSATLVLPDTTIAIDTLHVRATEYTVGPRGAQAMPASMPPTIAYTYAVELSADEAIAMGATALVLSQPVAFYVENFLGFPVGTEVPMGSYDPARAVWVPEDDGRVIRILSTTGDTATIDADGDSIADDSTQLAALGVTDAERVALAALYTSGQTLWRAQITHFTVVDLNFAQSLCKKGPGLCPPHAPKPPTDPESKDNPCEEQGSIIECENQTLGEAIEVVGTGFSLNYRSDRVPGRTSRFHLDIPLTGDSIAEGVDAVFWSVEIAGRAFEDSALADTNLRTTFPWDGRDAYGRLMQGDQPVGVTIWYRLLPSGCHFWDRFAGPGRNWGRLASVDDLTCDAIEGPGAFAGFSHSTDQWEGRLGLFDSRAAGLGGWTLSVHHAYDPSGQTLYLGTGERRSVGGRPVPAQVPQGAHDPGVVAGNGAQDYTGDGGPATEASLSSATALARAPDGGLYILDRAADVVRYVGIDGVIETVAGTGTPGFSGDSGPATEAQLDDPADIALAPDGSLYIADLGNFRVRRVAPDGTITTLAGTGDVGPSGDDGPAAEADLAGPVAVAPVPGGGLYIADGRTIRQLMTDGRIATVAGNDTTAGCAGDSIPAANSCFASDIVHLGVGPDARLYILEGGTPHEGGGRLRQINTDGMIKTVAGDTTGDCRFESGDGGPATGAGLCPTSFDFAGNGSILVADNGDKVRAFRVGGTIGQYWHGPCTNIGGIERPVLRARPTLFASREAGSAAQEEFTECVRSLVLGRHDALYVGDEGTFQVRLWDVPLPAFSNQELHIAAADGSEVYVFDLHGRHLSTRDALTGSARWTFGYDSLGALVTVTDADSNITTIERDSSTNAPTAIIGPFGQRTSLAIDSTGYLASVTNPAGFATTSKYAPGGLLDTLIDARGNIRQFLYDSLGLLVKDKGPAGDSVALARSTDATGYEVTLTTALGRVKRYREDTLAAGGRRSTSRGPDSLATVTTVTPDGTRTTDSPDGTRTITAVAADPRFGMQAPVLDSLTVHLPSNVQATVRKVRHDSLSNPVDPMSLVSQTDSITVNGGTTVSVYTAATRHFVQTSPEGRQLVSTLDAQGRVIAARVADLDSVRFTYDSLGRLVQQQQGGRSTAYTYHPASGQLASVTNALGRVTHFDYDSAGRVIRQTRPDSGVILFSYDSAGNLTSLTPPGDSAHGFQYTPVGLVQEYDPPGIPGAKPTKYFYNLDRQLDSIVRPDSVTAMFTYDSAGRPDSVTFDRGTLTYGYSIATGQLETIQTPEGDSLVFTYDGSLPQQVRWAGTVNGTVSVGYDNNFRVISQTVADTEEVDFAYDNDGLLIAAGALVFGRSPTNGLLLADTLGPVRSAYQYSSRGELTGLRVKYDTTKLFATGYSRDSLGRIVQLFDTTQGTATRRSFAYDSLGRLVTDSVNGAVFHAFTYDANGNRLSYVSGAGTMNYHYDLQDRLLWARVGSDTTKYTYGSNGELRTKTVPGVGTTTYTYDAVGNLITAVLPDSTVIAYTIDGQNRRVGRKVNGVLVQGWLYQNQLNPVTELDSAGNVVSRFVFGSRANVPDFMVKRDTVYRLIVDHLGSVRLVVDTATGTVAQRLDYDEWGNVTLNTNPGFQPFGFIGALYDSDTRLVRLGTRDYDAMIGRLTMKDQSRFVGGTNLYVYSYGDPINFSDRTGLNPCDCSNPLLVHLSGDLLEGVNFTLDPASNLPETMVYPYFAPDMADALSAAIRDMNHFGLFPQINSGYRTEFQQAYERLQHKGASGKSRHQLGYAVDINGTSDPIFNVIMGVMAINGFEWGGDSDAMHFQITPPRGDRAMQAAKVEEFFHRCWGP